jgi:hypothetical protein
VRAIVLYEWLAVAFQDEARLQNNLGTAYSDLPGGDRQANLERAIACYEAAIIIFKLARVDY